MKIITIIPAYNEEKTISSVVKGALTYSNVLVVDDGSIDQTSNLASLSGADIIKHSKNRGKGAAIKTGIKKALNDDYDVMVFIDGDGQHDPDSIPSLAQSIGRYDFIIGSRFKEDDFRNMPIQRRFSNKLTTKLISYVTGYHITDSQSGFRAISSNCAEIFLHIKYDDYVYESEALYQASKNSLLIKEEPISCNYQDEKSYIGLMDVLKYLKFIIRLFIRKIKRRFYFEAILCINC
ncbi:glycosyltransferase family 2 protein [Methanobacterium alcaliphilum]|uniref:glycosyltransferase family 2 protein n=1 Tax=Methanobacterium alcaliphilum TaxID=392018 RepID=UPI002009DD4B|nr:glycosyltransferase family 2 protein [Methanobacterium alcaliphilum]MCK9151582.1 glycosyltransferase family 2 protein [Methanobacterium alcaliphilum]